MARSYESIAKTVRGSWSPEARELAEKAGQAFDAEIETHRALGRRFEEARTEAGLTQSQLADRSGIGQAEISKIERGLGNPTAGTMLKLAAALGTSITLEPSSR